MNRRLSLLLCVQLLLCVSLLLAACGRGRSAEQPAPEPDAATVEEQTGEESEPDASATEEPVETPTAAESTTEQGTTDSVSSTALTLVDEVDSIQTYRTFVSMEAEEGERGAQSIQVKIDTVKQQRAERINVTLRENEGEPTVIDMIQLEDTSYFHAGDEWVASPGDGFFLGEVTVITPDVFQGSPDELQNLELVGTETVNGRTTVHYRGDKNAIPAAQAGSDSFDPQTVGEAQIDLWVDQAENFIVRMQLIANDDTARDRSMHVEIVHEYFDFNVDITIDAPNTGETIPDGPATAAEVDLTPILGFDLDLPADTPVLQYNEGRIVSILTSFTLDDTLAFFQSAMEANGYTLVNSAEVLDNEFVQIYTQGEKTVTVTIFTNDSGGTTINLGGTAPAVAPG